MQLKNIFIVLCFVYQSYIHLTNQTATMNQTFSTQTETDLYDSLQNKLTQIRADRKPVHSFACVSDWITYGAEQAAKKAEILMQLQILGQSC